MSKATDQNQKKVPVTWEDIVRGTDSEEKRMLIAFRNYWRLRVLCISMKLCR
jgi:hypothetical protein